MSGEENIELATMPSRRGRGCSTPNGQPNVGEAIVFLHGYSDSWFSYSRVLPLLATSYHAFALTQRGHGDSDKPECCYTPEDFAADVDAFMDAVGIEEATLVGASTEPLAQRVALSYPRRVSRLVLVGPQTPANESVMGLVEEVRALEDPVPPEFVRSSRRAPSTSRFRKSSSIRWSQESLKLPARVWRDYLEQAAVLSIDHDYVLPLREIDVPTLILWGSRIPLPARRTGAARGSDPRCHLEGLPETGHAVHWDRPEWVVRDLEEFM